MARRQVARFAVGASNIPTAEYQFRAVAAMACDQVPPLQAHIAPMTDQGDLEEVHDAEQQC